MRVTSAALGCCLMALPATVSGFSSRSISRPTTRRRPLSVVTAPSNTEVDRPVVLDHDVQAPTPGETGEEATSRNVAIVERGKSTMELELAVAGDTLETTPKMVGLVVAVWGLSLAALQPVGLELLHPNILSVLSLAATTVSAILFGDLFSGIFHWSTDNYGNGRTPVFGGVIEAFQGHHKNPFTITYRGFFNNVHKIALSAIPLTLATMALTTSAEARLFWVIFLNSQIMSQEFHKLSHTPKPPGLVSWLQNRNLIISKKEHGLHHTSPFEAHYCILTGTCNKVLDDNHVWRKLEAIIYRLNGVEPNCWREERGEDLKKFSLSLIK